MTSSPDPVFATALTYEREAAGWHLHTASDRTAWRASYERFLPLVPPGGCILDLGCGSGEDAPALGLSTRRIVGLDISLGLLHMARDQHASLQGYVLQGDLRTLPFADASFHGAWADGSLHHIPKADLPATLAEIGRILITEAPVAASFERGEGEGFVEHDAGIAGPRWYAHYEVEELHELFDGAGFKVIDQIVAEPYEHSTNGFIALFARKR